MGLLINKGSSKLPILEIKETDLTASLLSKVNLGNVAGVFTSALPSSNISTDKVYVYAGTDGSTVGGIVWNNGDSAYYNGSTWTKIPKPTNVSMNNAALIEATSGEDYEILVPTYDANGNVSSATVKWRDTATGVITITRDTNFLVASYTITHVLSGEATRTVTQATVTRNSTGKITNKPALTIA